MRVPGYIAVRKGKETRQFRDSNNAVAWLRQLDRQGFPGRVEVHFPREWGGGWCTGTPRFGITVINRRVEREGV